jgi:hypothetical protein
MVFLRRASVVINLIAAADGPAVGASYTRLL